MLTGLIVSHVRFHAYPFSAPEVQVSIIGVAAVGLALGLILMLLNERARAFGLALLLFFTLDLQFQIVRQLNSLLAESASDVYIMIAVAALAFTAFLTILSLRDNLGTLLSVAFFAQLVAIVALPAKTVQFGDEWVPNRKTPSSTGGIIVHIILDAHIGVEGVPTDIPGGTHLKEELLNLYTERGFQLYGAAYSPYLTTLNALSNALNATASATDLENIGMASGAGRNYRLLRNRYFQRLIDEGRNIHVYQSDYLDYCATAQATIARCYTYPVSSTRAFEHATIPASAKAQLMLRAYFSLSGVLNPLYRWFPLRPGYFGLYVPDVFDELRRDLLKAEAGDVFFAHMLLPHGPYSWDERCRLRPDVDTWTHRHSNREDPEIVETPAYRSRAYRDYFAQTHCVVKQLDAIFGALEKNDVFDQSTIVVHGDHGSGITIKDPTAIGRHLATERDYVDAFSTLFAIRSPGLEPRYVTTMRPLPALFSELVFHEQSTLDSETLYLNVDPNAVSHQLVRDRMPAIAPPTTRPAKNGG